MTTANIVVIHNLMELPENCVCLGTTWKGDEFPHALGQAIEDNIDKVIYSITEYQLGGDNEVTTWSRRYFVEV